MNDRNTEPTPVRDLEARFRPELEEYANAQSYPTWFSDVDRRQFVRWHRMRIVQTFLAQAERDTRPVLWMRARAALRRSCRALFGAMRRLSGHVEPDPVMDLRAEREARRERERMALLHRLDDRYRQETGAPPLDRSDSQDCEDEDS